jgi:hypothetical protein
LRVINALQHAITHCNALKETLETPRNSRKIQ